MSPEFTTLLAAAEALPAAERRELVERLLQGLDEPAQAEPAEETPPLGEAWRQEIARRSAEYDAGQTPTVS